MGVALDYINLIFIREYKCAGPWYMFNMRSINVTSLSLLGFKNGCNLFDKFAAYYVCLFFFDPQMLLIYLLKAQSCPVGAI